MKSKTYYWRDKSTVLKNKKRYLRAILIYSFLFFPVLAAQITILILDLLFFDSPLYQAFILFILIGHLLFLIIFLPITALWLMWVFKYRGTKKTLVRFEYSLPQLEEKLLLFLIDHKNKSFTPIEIQQKINHTGPLEELDAILKHLILTKKVKAESSELTRSYSINLSPGALENRIRSVCVNCGAITDPKSRFCTNCGKLIL